MTSCPDGFLCLQLKDIINAVILLLTVFAIYYGPLRALEISRKNDEIRQKREKERDILANLMKTRRATLDPLHVSSLNLVELEFSESKEIIDAYRKYIHNLSAEKLNERASSQEVSDFIEKRSDIFFDLVHAIAQKLGYNFDKRDLNKFSYTPQGWQNLEIEQQAFRRLIIELLSGGRGLPVTQFNPSDANKKYPPIPS